MATKDAHLYGIKRAKKSSNSNPQTTSNVNFSSALSSLIASSATASHTSSGRPRPSRIQKEDIFTTHNRNVRKRAAADMLGSSSATQRAKPTTASAPLDDDDYARSKRRMEEKARLYAALKRGDIEDESEKHMVDFDRKWAERQDATKEDSDLSSSSNGSDDEEDRAEAQVEYVDEFGRTRTGTALEARRAEVINARANRGDGGHDDRFTARPTQPTQLIFGDTVQTQAFDPDAPIAERMAELAAQRDREPTPPEAVHYDARKEVRTKGAGFFQFSQDEEVRQEQMRDLERERDETDLTRLQKETEAKARKEKRQRDLEERRKLVREQMASVRADQFLQGLGGEMAHAPQDDQK